MTVAVGEAARQAVIAAALEHLDALEVVEVAQAMTSRTTRFAIWINYRCVGRVLYAPELAREMLCAARAVERGGDA